LLWLLSFGKANESDSPAGARPGAASRSEPNPNALAQPERKTDPEGSVESTFQRQEEIKKTKVANSHYPGKKQKSLRALSTVRRST
jgi:hypothetical protein